MIQVFTDHHYVQTGAYLVTRMNNDCDATCMPGQMRRPKPKGNVNSAKRGLFVSRNRSGRKASGSGNISGSCMIPLSVHRIDTSYINDGCG